MKTLVVYYSRTGVTGTVAQALAGQLRADIEELRDRKSRRGPLGWLAAGKDATLKRLTDIDPPQPRTPPPTTWCWWARRCGPSRWPRPSGRT